MINYKKYPLFISLAISVFLTMISAISIYEIDSNHKDNIKESLYTVLNTTSEAIISWSDNQKMTAKYWAANKFIQQETKKLLSLKYDPKALKKNQSQLRERLRPLLEIQGYEGFFIISKDLINLASTRNTNIGVKSLLTTQKDLLTRVLRGETVISLPQQSDVKLDRNTHAATMFVNSPIIINGTISAILSFRINPHKDYTKVLQRGRIGKTGETYSFNKDGLMLSYSRYQETLLKSGLIKSTQKNNLSDFYIKVPPTNLEENSVQLSDQVNHPLTEMADSATKGHSSFNLKGYKDYRGVEVIGAWKWIEELNFGMTTEIDHDEAFNELFKTEAAFTILYLFSIIMTWLAYILFNRTQKKTSSYTSLLESFNSELEESVQKRTAEVEAANKAKSQFLATMSHEMRTPLATISGYIEELTNKELSKDQRVDVDNISSSTNFLLYLINDILDFSKIESGSLNIEHIPFCPHDTFIEILSLFEIMAKRKDIVFSIEAEDLQGKFFLGDPHRIKQILINLVTNAFKFTQEGSIKVNIDIDMTDNKNCNFSVTVADTGIGIPVDKQELIFKEFSQADGSTSRLYGGTGLGLSITKQIVHLMQGSVSVTSEVNKGSVFKFTLPLVSIAPPKKSSLPKNYLYTVLKNKHYIVAEDNKMNHTLLIKKLTKMGIPKHHIYSAYSGKEVLEILEHNHIDIVFMDCMMPEMDGYTATSKIRNQSKFDHIYIIAQTANAFTEDKEKCFKIGMNAFMSKPFSSQKIIKTLNDPDCFGFEIAVKKSG